MASAPAKSWHFRGWSRNMRNKNTWLVVIVILVAFSLWVDLSKNIVVYNPFADTPLIERDVM